jgi:hypothetical protein
MPPMMKRTHAWWMDRIADPLQIHSRPDAARGRRPHRHALRTTSFAPSLPPKTPVPANTP